MPVPDQATVERTLQRNDRDLRCRDAVEQAWTHCVTAYPDRAWWRRKSTSAALMWEHSVDNAINALSDDNGTSVVRHEDTTSFIFDDEVLLRFKKAGVSLLSRNYPTRLANLFHRHEADLLGFRGHQRVEIVHVFNRFETALEWIGVVARDRGQVIWQFELRQRGGEVVGLPPIVPLRPAADAVLRPIREAPTDNKTRDDL